MAVPFGQYELLRKLATGGMGQIFLARPAGSAGLTQLVVVKRLLPHLATNRNFLRMFLDEAKIASRLDHPGTVRGGDGHEGCEYLWGERARASLTMSAGATGWHPGTPRAKENTGKRPRATHLGFRLPGRKLDATRVPPRAGIGSHSRKEHIMGFFGFLLLGLLAGAIAKLILPGKQGGGWLITLVLGVVGALLGGFLGSVLFNAPLQDFFSIQTWLLAIGGSIIVLLIYGLIVGRRAAR